MAAVMLNYVVCTAGKFRRFHSLLSDLFFIFMFYSVKFLRCIEIDWEIFIAFNFRVSSELCISFIFKLNAIDRHI